MEKKKSNVNFEKSLTELQTHIDRLKTLHGSFTYAPLQTPLSKTKPFKFVPNIDGMILFSLTPRTRSSSKCPVHFFIYVFLLLDSIPPTYVTVNALRSSIKCVKQPRSPVPQQSTESNIDIKTTTKRQNENAHEQQQESVKRVRLLSRPMDDSSINSNRIVLRIRKPSEDLSSSRSETSNSSSSSSNPQLTVQIKEPLVALKEDDEDQIESPSLNVFEIFDPTSIPSKQDEK